MTYTVQSAQDFAVTVRLLTSTDVTMMIVPLRHLR